MKPSQFKLSKQFNPRLPAIKAIYSFTVSVSYPSGVWGGAPAADDFGVIHNKKEAFGAISVTLF